MKMAIVNRFIMLKITMTSSDALLNISDRTFNKRNKIKNKDNWTDTYHHRIIINMIFLRRDKFIIKATCYDAGVHSRFHMKITTIKNSWRGYMYSYCDKMLTFWILLLIENLCELVSLLKCHIALRRVTK